MTFLVLNSRRTTPQRRLISRSSVHALFFTILEQKTVAKPKTVPKTAKPKATTTKAATKSKAAKKVLVDHDDNADNIGMEEDVSDEDISVKKSQPAMPAKKKTASETYTKVRSWPVVLCLS